MASEVQDIDEPKTFVENVKNSLVFSSVGAAHMPSLSARSSQLSQRSQMDAARSATFDQDGTNADFVSLTDVKDNIIRSLQDRLDRSRILEMEFGTMQKHMLRNEEMRREMEEQLQAVYRERDSSVSEAVAAQQREAELRDEIVKYQNLLREANDRNEFHKQAYLDNQQARIMLEDLVMVLRSRFAQCWHFFSTVSARCQLPTFARFIFLAWAKECRGTRAARHQRSCRLSLVEKCTETVSLARAWQFFIRAVTVSRVQELENFHKRNAKRRFRDLVSRQGDSTRQQFVGEVFFNWSSFTQQQRATSVHAIKIKSVLQRCGRRTRAAILESVLRAWVAAFHSQKRLSLAITLSTDVNSLKNQVVLLRQAFFVWCTYAQMRQHFAMMKRHFDQMEQMQSQLAKSTLGSSGASQGTGATTTLSTRFRFRAAEDSSAPPHADDINSPSTSTQPMPPFDALSPSQRSSDIHRSLYNNKTTVPLFVAFSPPSQARKSARDQQMSKVTAKDDVPVMAFADEDAEVNREEAEVDAEKTACKTETDPDVANWNLNTPAWDNGASLEAQYAEASPSSAAHDLRYDSARSWEDDGALKEEENWYEPLFLSPYDSMSDEEQQKESQILIPMDTDERPSTAIEISGSDSPAAYCNPSAAFCQTSAEFGAVELDDTSSAFDRELSLHVNLVFDQPQNIHAEGAQAPQSEPPDAAMSSYRYNGIQDGKIVSSSPIQSGDADQRSSFFSSSNWEPQYVRLSLDFAESLDKSDRQFYSCVSAPGLSADDEAKLLYGDIINVDDFPLDSAEEGETLKSGSDGIFDLGYGRLSELEHFGDAVEQLQGEGCDSRRAEDDGLKSEFPKVEPILTNRTADASTSLASANHFSPEHAVATKEADLHERNTASQNVSWQEQRKSSFESSNAEMDNDATDRNTVPPNINQITEQTTLLQDAPKQVKVSVIRRDSAVNRVSTPSGKPTSVPSLSTLPVLCKSAPPSLAAKPVDSGPHPVSGAPDQHSATTQSRQNRVSFHLDDTLPPEEGHVSRPVGSNAPSLMINRAQNCDMTPSFTMKHQPRRTPHLTSGVSSAPVTTWVPQLKLKEGTTMGNRTQQQGQTIQHNVRVIPLQSSRSFQAIPNRDAHQRSASTEGYRSKQKRIDVAVQEFHRVVNGIVFVRDAQGKYSVNGTPVQLNVTPAGLELVDGFCRIPAMQFVASMVRSSGKEQVLTPMQQRTVGTFPPVRSPLPSAPMSISSSFPFFATSFPEACAQASKPSVHSQSSQCGASITPPQLCPQPTDACDSPDYDDTLSADIAPSMGAESGTPSAPLVIKSSLPISSMTMRQQCSNMWQKHDGVSRQPQSAVTSNVHGVANPKIGLQLGQSRRHLLTGMNVTAQSSLVGLPSTVAQKFAPPIGLGGTNA